MKSGHIKKIIKWTLALVLGLVVVAVVALLLFIKSMTARTMGDIPPILSGAMSGDLAKVKANLVAGANVNTRNWWGHTPLMLAAEEGHLAVVPALLAKGADVEAKDKNGWTALMYGPTRPPGPRQTHS